MPSLPSILRRWLGPWFRSARRPARVSHRRPRIEALEQRLAPATITDPRDLGAACQNLNDGFDTSGQLSFAVSALDPGVNGGLFEITVPVVISGGPVDLNGASILVSAAGSSVVGLTFSNGSIEIAGDDGLSGSASGVTVGNNGGLTVLSATACTLTDGGSIGCTTPNGITIQDNGTVSWENGEVTGMGTATISDTSVTVDLTSGRVDVWDGVSVTGSMGTADLGVDGNSNIGSGLTMGGGNVGIGGDGVSFSPSGTLKNMVVGADNVTVDGSSFTINTGLVNVLNAGDKLSNLTFTNGGSIVVGGTGNTVSNVTATGGVGLQLGGTNNTVGGMNVGGPGSSLIFGGSGNTLENSDIHGAEVTFNNATDDTLKDNYLHGAHGGNAISIQNGSSGNIIDSNQISCDAGNGISLGSNVTDTTIENNYIGTSQDGTESDDKELTGILIVALHDTGTIIKKNIISGNSNSGINIASEDDTQIIGNIIGLDANGGRLSNGTGITISGTASVTIGGTGGDDGNVIAGNTFDGIDLESSRPCFVEGNTIGTNTSGDPGLGNGGNGVSIVGSNNIIGGPGAGGANYISGNGTEGISIVGSNNAVQNNFIGLTPDGAAALPNGGGVGINGTQVDATDNTIGGTADSDRNYISGNTGAGISIQGTHASGNQISNNVIGLNTGLDSAVPNQFAGVYIYNAPDNTVGGSIDVANVISGNGGAANVWIAGSGATGNTVSGNFIGIEPGNTPVPNAPSLVDGVLIEGASHNTIGGTDVTALNAISGNTGAGIRIVTDAANPQATGNVVEGNQIGTDLSGATNIGNVKAGVQLFGASGNTIGGTGTDAANVIGENGSYGIVLDQNSSNNQMLNNYVGTDSDGHSVGNQSDGIAVLSSSNNTIGGTSAEGNVIKNNAGTGVVIDTGSGNAILSNIIDHNMDAPEILLTNGGNAHIQTALVTVTPSGGLTDLLATLSQQDGFQPGTTYTVQFFAAAAPQEGGGPAEKLVATVSSAFNAATGHIEAFAGVALPAGMHFVSATVTDPAGNTSQLSAAVASLALSITSPDSASFDTGTNGTFTFTTTGASPITLQQTGPLPDGVHFIDNGNGTATLTGTPTTAGTFPITITAHNGIADDFSLGFTLVVAQAADRLVIQGPTQVIAGGKFSVTVQAQNSDHQLDPAFPGSISLANLPGASLLAGTLTAPVVDGVATFNNLSIKTAGTANFFAGSTGGLLGASASINVLAAPHFKITLAPAVDNTTNTAGQNYTLTVTALGPNNQPELNYHGMVHFISTDPNADLPPDQPFNGVNGQETFTFVLNTPGSRTVTIADTSLTTVKTVSNAIVVKTGIATGFTISPGTAPIISGGVHTFTVTAVDSLGNRVTTLPAAFNGSVTISDAPDIPTPLVVKLTNGVGTFKATLRALGTQTLTASSGGQTSNQDVTVFSTATHFLISGLPTSIAAGQAINITVTPMDGANHAIANFADRIALAIPGGEITAGNGVLSGGVAAFTVVFHQTGSQTLTASDAGRPTIATKVTKVITPGAPVKFLVTFASPDVSGARGTVTVTAVDADNNVATQYHDKVQITGSTTAGVLATGTAVKGVAKLPLTLTALGTLTLTATQPVLNGIHGDSAPIVVVSSAKRFVLTGLPTHPVAPGQAVTINVRAVNAAGVTDTLFPDTINLSSSDPGSVFTPTSITLINGLGSFQVTFATLGSQTFKLTDAVRPAITTTSAAVKVAAPPLNFSAGVSGPFLPGVADPVTAAVPGQPLTFEFRATAAAPSAKYTYHINWGGVLQTVTGPGILTLTHVYSAIGNFKVSVTVTDAAGNTSSAFTTQQFAIQNIVMETDPTDGAKTALAIGAVGNIVISPTNDPATPVALSINNVAKALPAAPSPLGHLLIFGVGAGSIAEASKQFGADTVTVDIPALMFAGSATRSISAAGSGASNVLVGGAIKSTLTGGPGHDVMISGSGGASMNATHAAGDLLIAGTTPFNADVAALLAISDEWSNTSIDYEARVQALSGHGSGYIGAVLDPHAIVRDKLFSQLGGSGAGDWFLLASGDTLSGYGAGEAVTFEK